MREERREERKGGERKRGEERGEEGRRKGGEREERREESKEGELVQNADPLTQSLTHYLLNVAQTLRLLTSDGSGIWNDSLCKLPHLVTARS